MERDKGIFGNQKIQTMSASGAQSQTPPYPRFADSMCYAQYTASLKCNASYLIIWKFSVSRFLFRYRVFCIFFFFCNCLKSLFLEEFGGSYQVLILVWWFCCCYWIGYVAEFPASNLIAFMLCFFWATR